MSINNVILSLIITLVLSTTKEYSSLYQKVYNDYTKVKRVNFENNYLSANDTIKANKTLFSISNDYLLSGCQYYPLKHVILGLLNEYFEQTSRTVPHFQIYMHTLSFVYELLYYYHKNSPENNNSSSFYTENLSNTQRDFLSYILQTTKSNIYSKNDLTLLHKLGLNDNTYGIVNSAFEYVNNHSKEKFVKDKETFFKLYNYIVRNSFPLRMDTYIKMNSFKESDIREYDSLLQKQKTPIKNCFILSPLLSLIEMKVNDDSYQPVNYMFRVSKHKLMVYSPQQVNTGRLIRSTSLPNENAYFDFGYTDDTSYTLRQALLLFHKDVIGTDKRREICFMTDCEGMGIERDYYKGYFILSNRNLNPYLINMGRLLSLNDTTIDKEKQVKVFQEREYISKENELGAYLHYFKIIEGDIIHFKELFDVAKNEENSSSKARELIKLSMNNLEITLSNMDYLLDGMEHIIKSLI